MFVPFFDITRQNLSLKNELDAALSKVVASGHYILGENVSLFEKEIAAYCGTKHAVGVASGTDALHLALLACGVKAGDEVITSPFSFVATTEAIAYCGATPVFVDIKPNSFNLNPALIENKITNKTRAILPVHLYGQACEMDKINQIASRHNLKVVEDCAQAFGAAFKGQKVGSFGAAGCFSFFPTKNIGCFGDGGIITTHNDEIAHKIRILRGHGSSKTYHYEVIGFNSRLDELQAAVLRVKMVKIDSLLQARRRNAALYSKKLADIAALSLPIETDGAVHTYNQYTVRHGRRDQLLNHLRKNKIGSMVYYPLSLHLQPAFAHLGYQAGDFPESEAAQNSVLSLPIFPELTENEINAAIAAVITAIHED